MIEQIEELENAFTDMESNGKVDLDSSLPVLDYLALRMRGTRDDKINESKSNIEKFQVYHLSMVSLIVLESMKKRLVIAGKIGDNPSIATDSLRIISNLKKVVIELNKKPAGEKFLDLASELQIKASRFKLFYPDESRLWISPNSLREVVTEMIQLQQDGKI